MIIFQNKNDKQLYYVKRVTGKCKCCSVYVAHPYKRKGKSIRVRDLKNFKPVRK